MIPEKWVIKITPENKPILQKYNYCNKEIGYDYTMNAYYGNSCYGEWDIQADEVEIDIEYFIKHIVNNEPFIYEFANEDHTYLKSFLKKLKIK